MLKIGIMSAMECADVAAFFFTTWQIRLCLLCKFISPEATAKTDGAIEDFTTATSDGAIRGSHSLCVVVVVSCATDWSGDFRFHKG